jgi:hypothetical protein
MTQGEFNVWLDVAKIALAHHLAKGNVDLAVVLAADIADSFLVEAKRRTESQD